MNNQSAWQDGRRMVPRWRSLGVTFVSGELASPSRRKRSKNDLGELQKAEPIDLVSRLERWRLAPELVTAAELVEAAIVEGRERDAIGAARRIVTIDNNAAPLIREQAARLLARNGFEEEIPFEQRPVRPAISPRQLISLHDRDPLAWVELAFQQTTKGHADAAWRSMSVALRLAPNNRHVLRSAARLLLHKNDPEKALALISRNDATKFDPWLMSSEIALAQVISRSPKYIKLGLKIIEGKSFDPRQITELAGAIGTEELLSGNRKKAKRLFGESMADPTGSAAAQGEWATPAMGVEIVPEARLASTFENAEAMAFHNYRTRNLKNVADHCRAWAENDPFSIRPFEFGAATSGFIEDFDTVIEFAMRGLALRPDSAELLNATAFAHGSLGNIELAEAALRKIGPNPDDVQRIIKIANTGLIEFRKGRSSAGELLYNQAMKEFQKVHRHDMAARARIYLAREAIIAKLPTAHSLLAQARDGMKLYKENEGYVSLVMVEKIAQSEDLAANMAQERPNVALTRIKQGNGVGVTVRFEI